MPRPLPQAKPLLAPDCFVLANWAAELALARLSGVAGLVPSADWLLYGVIRKEALLSSQIEGTQATLVDLFDAEAGFAVSNTDDVQEVANYLRAFRRVQAQLRDPGGVPLSVRLLCDAHRLLLDGAGGIGAGHGTDGAKEEPQLPLRRVYRAVGSVTAMTEDQLEQETLGWLRDVGYTT